MTTEERESPPQKDSFQLRTARVDGFDVANVAFEERGDTFWRPLRYEFTDLGDLRVFQCNDEIWFDAVARGELEGKASRGQHGRSTSVSASGERLLAFVRAHRDAVFLDEPIVLRRAR